MTWLVCDVPGLEIKGIYCFWFGLDPPAGYLAIVTTPTIKPRAQYSVFGRTVAWVLVIAVDRDDITRSAKFNAVNSVTIAMGIDRSVIHHRAAVSAAPAVAVRNVPSREELSWAAGGAWGVRGERRGRERAVDDRWKWKERRRISARVRHSEGARRVRVSWYRCVRYMQAYNTLCTYANRYRIKISKAGGRHNRECECSTFIERESTTLFVCSKIAL